MKTEPTDLDREAARLFTPAPGMRMWIWLETGEDAVRFLGRTGVASNPLAFDETRFEAVVEILTGRFRVTAIDSDDPATVGAMVAQFDRHAVTVVDRRDVLPGDVERRFAVLAEFDGAQTLTTGPTRGAALVAAMKAIKAAP